MNFNLLIGLLLVSYSFGSVNLGDGFTFSFGAGSLSFTGPAGTSSSFTLAISQLDEVNSNNQIVQWSTFGAPQIGGLSQGSQYDSLELNVPITVNSGNPAGLSLTTYAYLTAINAVNWPGTAFAVPDGGFVLLGDFGWPIMSTSDVFFLNGTIAWDISSQDIVNSLFTNLQLVYSEVKNSQGGVIGGTVGIEGGMSVTVEIPSPPLLNSTGGNSGVTFSAGSIPVGASGSTTWSLKFDGIAAGVQLPVMMIIKGSASSFAPVFFMIIVLISLLLL